MSEISEAFKARFQHFDGYKSPARQDDLERVFKSGAQWQAEQDRLDESGIAKVAARRAVKIAELEAELDGIKSRDAEVGEDESWWIGGAWGDYGEAVVPLRILSYVIDGNLDEKIASTDPGFAITYAEQVARADAAEAKLAKVREQLLEPVPLGSSWMREWDKRLTRMLAILDGEGR